jgi:5-methyltetrahydrofolate--homocysteine methyltransferase
MNKHELINEIKKNVILGRIDKNDEGFNGDMEGEPGTLELIDEAVKHDIPAETLLTEGLSASMDVVGQKYQSGEYLVPDMLASAECVSAGMDILEPLLVNSTIETKGQFVMATVEGDLHDIGKNIVSTMLKGAGYAINDLGTGVTAAKIIETAKSVSAEYIGLSALLTTTMVKMQSVIDLLKAEGMRENVKVLIGGAPTSPEFAEKIGADAYCADAFATLEVIKQF